jgi:hypothetical protein
MRTFAKDPMPRRTRPELFSPWFCEWCVGSLCFLLLAGTILLSACGGGNSNAGSQIPAKLSGNWQFTMAAPADGSFLGGLQGGFLLQNNTAVTGAAAYSVALPANPNPTVCNSGSAAITGTLTGQSVAFTAAAGTQTFTMTGTLSFDGSTMGGTYTSTAGTAANGTPCGTVQPPSGLPGLQWSAILVPPITGPIQGTFHSTGGAAGLSEQDFAVSGTILQGENTGASNATVTGSLNFVYPGTNLSDYPCLTVATVSGQISGNIVILQIAGAVGSNVGQIGPSPGAGLQTVTFDPTQGGYVLQSLAGAGYAVYAAACGGGSLDSPADTGNICLAVNSTTACLQPITLTPPALSFPSQTLGSISTLETITLANTSGASLGGLTLTLTNNSGMDNFTETDTCGLNGVSSLGEPFILGKNQSCVITIAFTPLENCSAGASAAACLSAMLTVTSPDNDAIFNVAITGGVAASAASARRDVEHHADIH